MRKAIPGVLVALLVGCSAYAQQAQRGGNDQAAPERSASGVLREIIPGHYAYTAGGFTSGVVDTSDGVVVLDALASEAVGRAERDAITKTTQRPIRVLVSSTFHDNYSRGNLAYADVWKIGQENYRTDLVALLQRQKASPEEQKARLPNETFRDHVTLYLGGKEIQVLYVGRAHTRGDSIIYVPQDRIAYLSEVFFLDQFPFMDSGYGVDWLKALDTVEALGADIYIPGHGAIPADPRDTKAALDRARQVLVDIRDGVAQQIASGATEEQAVAALHWPQYENMRGYENQRATAIRRFYEQLTGTLK